MSEDQMRVVCEYPVGTLRTALAVDNITMVAMTLRQMPGVGQPFLAFASLSGPAVMADFDLHPDWAGHGNLVTNDVAKNAAMVQAMLDNPPLDAIVL
ncbi:hypothetical protein [Mesorhizobium sp. CAU 1741]|uniref:hypothetical protein n=1 Tax=Mesorhizobium sp. CAU 1741 TaxID=3140366 RepID=UPI00325AEB41